MSQSSACPGPPEPTDPQGDSGDKQLLIFNVVAFSQSEHDSLHPSKLLHDLVSHSSITPDFP